MWNDVARYVRVELMRKAGLDEDFIESIASYPWGNIREGEKRKVRPAIKQWLRGFTESHEWCGWCGAELPPYELWKYVLCPKCWESINPEKSGSGNPLFHYVDGMETSKEDFDKYVKRDAPLVSKYMKVSPIEEFGYWIGERHTYAIKFEPISEKGRIMLGKPPEKSGSGNPKIKVTPELKERYERYKKYMRGKKRRIGWRREFPLPVYYMRNPDYWTQEVVTKAGEQLRRIEKSGSVNPDMSRSDFDAILHAKLGWAVAEQAQEILGVRRMGDWIEVKPSEKNWNAVKLIWDFVRDRTDEYSEDIKTAIINEVLFDVMPADMFKGIEKYLEPEDGWEVYKVVEGIPEMSGGSNHDTPLRRIEIGSPEFNKLLYEFMREMHPITYRRWVRDLIKEKQGLLKTEEGWQPWKEEVLKDWELYKGLKEGEDNPIVTVPHAMTEHPYDVSAKVLAKKIMEELSRSNEE